MNVLENFKNLFADVWNKGVSGINISEIIIALIIFIFFLFLRGIFSKFVVKRLEKYVSKTTNIPPGFKTLFASSNALALSSFSCK